jgi:hypothetical protein
MSSYHVRLAFLSKGPAHQKGASTVPVSQVERKAMVLRPVCGFGAVKWGSGISTMMDKRTRAWILLPRQALLALLALSFLRCICNYTDACPEIGATSASLASPPRASPGLFISLAQARKPKGSR